MQGDVLKRTVDLDAVLAEVHPHYHRHTKNLFFMVVTQSCDLVVRSDGAKAPYINIVPVRSLDEVISRQVANLTSANVKTPLPLLTDKSKSRLSEFLRRLLNNNEPSFFYLESDDTELGQDCCAFLRLSIPIKTDLHYKKCLDAKILQLNENFQSKLGSLVGQMFSRVATKDWDSRAVDLKLKRLIEYAAIFVPDSKLKVVEAAYKTKAEQEQGCVLTEPEIAAALKGIPTKKQLVLDRTIAIASQLNIDATLLVRFQKRLANDSQLTSLLKEN